MQRYETSSEVLSGVRYSEGEIEFDDFIEEVVIWEVVVVEATFSMVVFFCFEVLWKFLVLVAKIKGDTVAEEKDLNESGRMAIGLAKRAAYIT